MDRKAYSYTPRIVIYPQPSVADPAHLIAYSLKSETEPNGIIVMSGTKLIRAVIWYLGFLIRRNLQKGISKADVVYPTYEPKGN
jgi:hypothetical protein